MNQHVSIEPASLSAARQVSGNFWWLRMLKIGVIVVELVLIAQALSGQAWQILALGHVAVVGTLLATLAVVELRRADSGALQTFILLTFAGGPIGAVAALIGEQQIWHPKSDMLDKWYNTIAPEQVAAVTLVDMIIDGRLVRQQSALPRPYDALLNTGTMQEKQALLAYLAIEDDEKFVEVALALALRSPDQRVRVQAAAVAAHTKARARRRDLDFTGPGSIRHTHMGKLGA